MYSLFSYPYIYHLRPGSGVLSIEYSTHTCDLRFLIPVEKLCLSSWLFFDVFAAVDTFKLIKLNSIENTLGHRVWSSDSGTYFFVFLFMPDGFRQLEQLH